LSPDDQQRTHNGAGYRIQIQPDRFVTQEFEGGSQPDYLLFLNNLTLTHDGFTLIFAPHDQGWPLAATRDFYRGQSPDAKIPVISIPLCATKLFSF
jgi:hypothetical protein